MESIIIKGPYNFDQVLDRMAIDPLNVVNFEEQTVKVPLFIDGKPIVATVKSVGTIDVPKFQVFVQSSNLNKVLKRLKEIFQWDHQYEEIHAHFMKTDLSPIFEQYRGMPIIRDFDPYRSLIKSIIHQQLNMKFAYMLSTRFAQTFGFEKDGVYFYPKPEQVASLTPDDLRELQFSQRKGEYVIGVAKEIVHGNLNLYELDNKSDEEIIKELTKLRGVGPWTAQNFLLFGLGRKNLFPMADIGIQNAIKKLYQLDRKPTYEEMERYKKPWEPYLSYASLYLWRSIE